MRFVCLEMSQKNQKGLKTKHRKNKSKEEEEKKKERGKLTATL